MSEAITTTTSTPPRARLRPQRTQVRRLHRSVLVGLTAACLSGASAAAAAGAGVPARAQATQELAVLLSAHGARRAPDAASPRVALVAPRRPITGEQTTLPVISRSIAPGGARWLQVMLPGRPDGSTGWIAERGTRALVTPWRIAVDLSVRRILVYDNGRMLKSFQAVVGKPSTPTPTGQFFVEETLRMSAGEAGGPFALALSARSNVLQEFEGGPGQIAMHGRENLGGTLGTASSHGCIRLGTGSIDWLAARVSPGVPVTIKG